MRTTSQEPGPNYDGFRTFLDVRDNRMDFLGLRGEQECSGCPRRCTYDANGRANCPLIQWENAAASFRYRAHNVDLAGRRDLKTLIDEALGDQRIPMDFRDELRRQFRQEQQRRVGGERLDERLRHQYDDPGEKEHE